ncbi:3669_t:CDS:1, partial [Paraglomus occultum]
PWRRYNHDERTTICLISGDAGQLLVDWQLVYRHATLVQPACRFLTYSLKRVTGNNMGDKKLVKIFNICLAAQSWKFCLNSRSCQHPGLRRTSMRAPQKPVGIAMSWSCCGSTRGVVNK